MIRNRLILLFAAQTAAVLLLAGFTIQFQLRGVLERELGDKLTTVAATAAATLPGEVVQLLGPGDDGTRTFTALRQQLEKLNTAAGMQRLLVTSPRGDIILDTAGNPIGAPYTRFDFYIAERRRVARGEPTASLLFQRDNGDWSMSGFAPLLQDRELVGVVAVEGSAASLATVNQVRRNLFWVGAVSLLLAVLLAGISSQRITAPLTTLKAAAARIAGGDFKQPIVPGGHGEIRLLGETMETMRRAINQRDKRQQAMLASVAHEIRNPLGGIKLFGDLLHDELAPDQRQKLEKIMQEARNIETIAGMFIDFASPINVNPQRVDIRAITESCRGLLADALKKTSVKLEIDGDAAAICDPQHARQIIFNLLQNAVDAAPPQSVVRIDIQSEKHRVEIRFINAGEPIPPKVQNELFEPFFSTKEKGSGLGLPMSRNLAEANGGTIELEQSRADATVFRLMLPAANPANEGMTS